ncbi:HNH endonuclease [Actinomadura citrea]|uniref:HNH endonuclease n=1 Tax=Actinomadura citrea TaxID=46158 RepID=UPI003CE47047
MTGSTRAARTGVNHPGSAKRRAIKRKLARRDGAQCFYCAHPFGDLAEATLDHLIPFSVLPTWKPAALVLACRPCNQAKGDRLPQTLMRPSGYGPGLVPVPSRTVARTVRRAVRTVVHRMTAGPSVRLSAIAAWLHARTVRPPVPTPEREASHTAVPDASEVVTCGRCGKTCQRDRLADEPARWLLARPPVRAAYCWRCAAAIADELLLGVAP